MKTKAIPKVEDEVKKDYFTDYLERHVPIPDNTDIEQNYSVQTYHAYPNEDSNADDITEESIVEDSISEIAPLDIPLRYDDIYHVIDTNADSVLVENIPYAKMISYTANFMLWGFMLSVRNSLNMEVFAYNAETDSVGSTDDQVVDDIISQYWLYVDTAKALSKNKSIFNHLQIKHLMLTESIDYETARNKVMSEETSKVLKQQNAVIKAMPGLITKTK